MDEDDWGHAACVMWAGIKVSSQGSFSGLIRGISQGLGSNAPKEDQSCKHCGYSIRSCIAAKCQAPGCSKVMHFFCAALVGWLVIDKYNCFCGRHKPRNESKKKEFEAKVSSTPLSDF